MNLKDLSKEQKQYLVLGVLGVVILIALVIFGVKSGLNAISVTNGELMMLTSKIESADRALSRRVKTRAENAQTVTLLRSRLENLPPENYYAASEIIYPMAKKTEIEIDAIDEIRVRPDKATVKAEGEFKLESFTLKISARGGYENVKLFLKTINQDCPLARLTGVEIGVGSTPEMHNVQIFMQWPRNVDVVAKNLKAEELKLPVKIAAQPKPQPEQPVEVAALPEPVVVPEEPEEQPAVTVQEEPEPVVVPEEPEQQQVVTEEPETEPEQPVVVAEQPEPVAVPMEPEEQPDVEVQAESVLGQPEPAVVPEEQAVVAEPRVGSASYPLAEGSIDTTNVTPREYVTTSNSVEKLKELLKKTEPETSTSFSSFLDSMMEGDQ